MTRIHDMGGRFGDGPVKPDFGEVSVFEEEWHARTLALTVAAGFLGQWNLDESRHRRECLSPVDYIKFSYYEKWLAGLADILVAKGIVTKDELETLNPEPTQQTLKKYVLSADNVFSKLRKGGPTYRDVGSRVKFKVGDKVITSPVGNKNVSGGHTRLPTYAAGKKGKILLYHGRHVFPDSNAHGMGEAPEPLFTVAFSANDLWKHAENPKDMIMLDLWQSYLSSI